MVMAAFYHITTKRGHASKWPYFLADINKSGITDLALVEIKKTRNHNVCPLVTPPLAK